MNNTLRLKEWDPWLWPIGAILGWVIGWVFSWIRWKEPRRLLIIRPGGMGDLILLVLAWEDLQKELRQKPGYQSVPVTWLIERRAEAWARHLKLDYQCYDEKPVRVLKGLAGRFSRVINTEQRFGLSQAFALACRRRKGVLSCFDTNLGKAFADLSVSYDPDLAYERDEFARLLGATLGLGVSKKGVPPSRRCPSSGVWVVGLAGLQSPSRTLSVQQWEEFIRRAVGKKRFLLVASPTDTEFQYQLANRFEKQCQIFRGSFDEVSEAIMIAERLITIDGGLVHVASYYGVPTTVIFTSGRSQKWAPLAPGSEIWVRKDLPCQPCTLFGQVPTCHHEYACREVL